MARSFNGTSAYLEAASAAVTAEPLTMACWFRTTSASGQVKMSIGTSGGTARWQMSGSAGGSGFCTAANSVGTTGDASSGTVVSGRWHHIAGVFTSSSFRTCYLDGIPGTVNTTAITVSGVNRTIIGMRIASGSAGAFASGEVFDAAIWSVVLTAPELTMLSCGVRASEIRRESLVFYNPMDDRWTYDRARGLFMSDVGSTGAAEDPPFLQKPRRKYFLFGETSAPASVIFRNRTGSRSRLIA